MKLASLKAGRDGALIVASRDLTRAVGAGHIAPTMQAALDDWSRVEPLLKYTYKDLNEGRLAAAFPLDFERLAAPLPRAFQWCDGSAYVNHVELVRKARGAEMPPSFWTDPLMYQGGSDRMLGPREDVPVGSEDWGIDMEAEVAVIVDDVPMGASPTLAAGRIRLIVILNDVSLRNLIPAELAKGFGFFHGKPPTAFSPVAVTPDELGDAWDGRKVSLPLRVELNGERFGEPEAGVDMTFDFPTLIAHAAKTRPLGAGTIVGAGTVSNVDRSKGSSCIAERRALEMIEEGKPSTPFMKFGDRVRIEMLDRTGRSIFGAIDQRIVRYASPAESGGIWHTQVT
jgi:fumarylacetoacetate (FAA) hydrolase